MQWRHLNVFHKECLIVRALPRGRRGGDSKVYRGTLPRERRNRPALFSITHKVQPSKIEKI
jgi:hypothetical protein